VDIFLWQAAASNPLMVVTKARDGLAALLYFGWLVGWLVGGGGAVEKGRKLRMMMMQSRNQILMYLAVLLAWIYII
jgi:hypothetical protein